MSVEYRDYPNGAIACAAIAKKVYQEVVNEGTELLKEKTNFDWTQTPQVRTSEKLPGC